LCAIFSIPFLLTSPPPIPNILLSLLLISYAHCLTTLPVSEFYGINDWMINQYGSNSQMRTHRGNKKAQRNPASI
jgi:hypothetical protein